MNYQQPERNVQGFIPGSDRQGGVRPPSLVEVLMPLVVPKVRGFRTVKFSDDRRPKEPTGLTGVEARRLSRRRWEKRNPEKVYAKQKRAAMRHPERAKLKWQRYMKKHGDKYRARARQRYREKVNARKGLENPMNLG